MQIPQILALDNSPIANIVTRLQKQNWGQYSSSYGVFCGIQLKYLSAVVSGNYELLNS